MPVLRAAGLSKSFDGRPALRGVDLTVAAGEVRGLLGANGAGKSTLLRLLLGLVAPDEGSVELFGRRARPGDGLDLDGVAGFVEEPTFYPYLSARDNLIILAELDRGAGAIRIDGVLERVGLRDRAPDRVSTFSTGMRQRLGLAAALLREPRLLLLDEPTTGVDPSGAGDLIDLVRSLAAEDIAILVSSHQIAAVQHACDGFTILHEGAVVWSGTAAQLRDEAPRPVHRMRTSDDRAALGVAERVGDVLVATAPDGGILITAGDGDLDAFVLGLGRAGVAVRELQAHVEPLEAMFLTLTTGPTVDESEAPPPRRGPAIPA